MSGSFANLLQWLLACVNFILNSESLFCWYNQKNVSMNYGRNTNSWKPPKWVRLDLIFTMRDIFIHSHLNPLTNSSAAAEALSLKISCHGTSVHINRRIVISSTVKRGIPFWGWWEVNRNWDNHKIRISQWRESHCRTNTSSPEEINKSKKAELWKSQSGIQVGKLTICDRESLISVRWNNIKNCVQRQRRGNW